MTLRASTLANLPESFSARSLIPLKDDGILALPFTMNQQIYIYSLKTDRWTPLFTNIRDSNESWKGFTFDEEKRELLLMNRYSLWSVNVDTRSVQMKWSNLAVIDMQQIEIYTDDDDLHVFESSNNQILHFILNKYSGEMVQNTKTIAGNMVKIGHPKWVQSRNCITVFGYDDEGMLKVFEYLSSSKQWKKRKKRKMKGCKTLRFYHPYFVFTEDERYAFIWDCHYNTKRQMHAVFDLEMGLISKLVVDLPFDYVYQACTLRDVTIDEALIFGFVRESIESVDMQNGQSFPVSLIQLIGKWVWTEYMHFIDAQKRHWKISVDELLQSRDNQ